MFNKYQRKLCFALEDTTPTTQIVAKYIRSASLFQECFCRRRKRSADIIRRISRTLFFCCFFLSRWFPRMSACSVWAKIYACGYSFINGHSCKMFFLTQGRLLGWLVRCLKINVECFHLLFIFYGIDAWRLLNVTLYHIDPNAIFTIVEFAIIIFYVASMKASPTHCDIYRAI